MNEEHRIYTRARLAQLSSLPLRAKVHLTMRRVRQWHDSHDGIYLSYSGGKDSTVLLHIIRQMYDASECPAVFVNTGLEWPGVKRMGIRLADEVLTPSMRFKDVLRTYGYAVVSKETSQKLREARTTKSDKLRDLRLGAGRHAIPGRYRYLLDAPFKISEQCCTVFKKRPAKAYEHRTGRAPVIATMASESDLRRQSWMKYGCNAFAAARPISRPMSVWTEQDVLEYIVTNRLEIAPEYGQIEGTPGNYHLSGMSRTGCMFCLYGLHLNPGEAAERFRYMREHHPHLYELCINDLGLGEIMNFMNIDFKFVQTRLFD